MIAQTLVQALNLNQAKNGSIIAIAACAVLVLLVLKFISSLVVRLVLSIVFAALGVVVYSQRASLVDCADKLTASASAPSSGSVTCTFFGRDVKIDLGSNVDLGTNGG